MKGTIENRLKEIVQLLGLVSRSNFTETIDDTNAHTVDWYGFLVLEDTVVSSLSSPSETNVSAWSSRTLTAGMNIIMRVSSITLTSGAIQGYKK